MDWLNDYGTKAALTDRLQGRNDHIQLLAAGLMGEGGSILAEVKKMKREKEAYPAYRHRLLEEFGDFLWYFVRLASTADPRLLSEISAGGQGDASPSSDLAPMLAFGSAIGEVLEGVQLGNSPDVARVLKEVWLRLTAVARAVGLICRKQRIRIWLRSRAAGRREGFSILCSTKITQ